MSPKFNSSMTQLALVFENGNELTFDDFCQRKWHYILVRFRISYDVRLHRHDSYN